MDKELFEMLRLFAAPRSNLTIQDLCLLQNTTEDYVAPRVIRLYKSGYLAAVGGYIPEDGSLALDTKLQRTYAGEHAMTEYKQKKVSHFWTELRAWATAIIALAAFIKSFFF